MEVETEARKRRNHTGLLTSSHHRPDSGVLGTHAKPPHTSSSSCAGFNAHGAFLPTSLPVFRPGPLPGVPSLCFCVLDPLSLKGDARSPTKLIISSPELSQETLLAPASPPGIM